VTSATLFNLFEVPARDEQGFLAGWQRARDFIDARGGLAATTLHRSIAPHAEFRFVNVAEIDSVETWRGAIASEEFPQVPGVPHPALYEAVRDDPEPDGVSESVVLINAFEVPEGRDEEFLMTWEHARDWLREQPGYLGTRLHRSLDPNAEFRYVNRGTFRTADEFTKAISNPAFPGGAMRFRSHPMLYEVVSSRS
jgi:heme-degrading monooxygenase HmoA